MRNTVIPTPKFKELSHDVPPQLERAPLDLIRRELLTSIACHQRGERTSYRAAAYFRTYVLSSSAKKYNYRNRGGQTSPSLIKFIVNNINIYVSKQIYYENIFYN